MTNKRLVWYLKKEKKIDDRQSIDTIDAISKITTKLLNRFKRKEKMVAIFFNIEKAYDKVNRDKTLEKLENIGIQGRMLRFIGELNGKRWSTTSVSQSKQTALRIPQECLV